MMRGLFAAVAAIACLPGIAQAQGALGANYNEHYEDIDYRDLEKAGAQVMIVAPKVGSIRLGDRSTLKADMQLAGAPSVLFDAVALLLTPAAAEQLTREAAAVQFVMDAFGHCKTIGADAAAAPLLERAGVERDAGVTALGKAFVKAAGQRHYGREATLRTLA